MHERRRESLVTFARTRLQAQLKRRGAGRAEMDAADEALDPEVLTIGFARRFATYKRATLLLRDPDRLESILNHPERPVQIIFAGKAHPRDDAGKELIRQVVTLARQERFRRRLIFIEDYDSGVSRFLVQGCDVWLNTPRRPMEASGTSGMKAAANGVLNMSHPRRLVGRGLARSRRKPHTIGWAIGRGGDQRSGISGPGGGRRTLSICSTRHLAAFYERRADGLPRRWTRQMERFHRHPLPAVQHAARGARIRHELLRDRPTRRRCGVITDRGAERARRSRRGRRGSPRTGTRCGYRKSKTLSGANLAVGDDLTVLGHRSASGAHFTEEVAVELYLGRLQRRWRVRRSARPSRCLSPAATAAGPGDLKQPPFPAAAAASTATPCG